MVKIDGRGLKLRDLFIALRDVFKMQTGEVSVELLVDKDCDLKKLKAFLSMSACQAEVEEKNGENIVRITGGCCSCR